MKLKRADAATAADAREGFLDFYAGDGRAALPDRGGARLLGPSADEKDLVRVLRITSSCGVPQL